MATLRKTRLTLDLRGRVMSLRDPTPDRGPMLCIELLSEAEEAIAIKAMGAAVSGVGPGYAPREEVL